MGYEQSTLGKVCMACVQALTATILSLYVLFLYGYYANCEFKSIDNLCFFGDYGVWGDFDTNSEAFFALWCVALVWFTGLLNWADQIRLFFLIPCSLCAAQLVWVWVPTEECSAVETTSAVLRVARALRKRVLSSKQGHAMLCKVVYPDDASIPPFFEFQCSRYVVHDRDLKRVEIKATSSAEQVRAQQDGLSTEMAKHRECLIGPNLIPFKVDTFGSLLLAEIQSLFYLYQLLVYMIWFWFSYTFIAAIMASVVVLSAVLNVVIKKSNQETIQTMTTYETTVSVKRNGKWRHGVSSHKLVPGDVILLQSDLYEWTMPCDAVLLAGTCVCDESGLTGESMPVQKVSVPFTERDANPSDSRHNLFAGTVLLQATGPNNDANGSADATALVTATGITSCKGQFIADILFPTKMVFEYDEELPLVVMILGLYALVAASMAVYFQLKSEAQNNFVTIFACKYIFSFASR
jgi:magnesium-transporting ATPase (P-type)